MALYDLSEKIYNTRMAGRIRRLHIRPMNGEEQNVAAHTWGVAMILLDLFPKVSKETLVFTLRHDVPEVCTGDVPANVKWENPELEETLEWMERKFLEQMGWPTNPPSSYDLYAIKIADRIELLFYCLEQMYMGNWLLFDVYENVRNKMFEDIGQNMPDMVLPVTQYVAAYSGFLEEKFSQTGKFPRDGLSIS